MIMHVQQTLPFPYQGGRQGNEECEVCQILLHMASMHVQIRLCIICSVVCVSSICVAVGLLLFLEIEQIIEIIIVYIPGW